MPPILTGERALDSAAPQESEGVRLRCRTVAAVHPCPRVDINGMFYAHFDAVKPFSRMMLGVAALGAVAGCSGSGGLAETQTDASTSAGQCHYASGVGDGKPGSCGAGRALIDCEAPNGSGCGCMTDGTTCPGCGTGATCTNKCAADEYVVSCGGIGPTTSQFNPPAACHFAGAVPAGIAYYCCPCL